MRTFLLTAALLLSSAASAQVTFTFGANNSETLSFGKDDCQGRSVSVTWTRTIQPCQALALWLSPISCSGASADISKGEVALTDVSLANFQAATTGTFTFNITDLPFGSADAGPACGGNIEKTFFLCGATRQFDGYSGCSATVVNATTAKINYDGKPPAAPSITSAVGLDRAARVTLTAPSDAATGEVVVYDAGGGEVRQVAWTKGQAFVQVDGLENDVTYQVEATVSDEAGNPSPASERVEVTPTKTYGYMALYVEAGGQETGGCGAVGGGVAGGAVLAVLGFWLFSRRNRSWLEQ